LEANKIQENRAAARNGSRKVKQG